jgi:hypothetical protein
MSDSNVQAITPSRAGFGKSRDIVPGDNGIVVSAAKRIAASTSDPAGVDLKTIIVRMYAQGIPLWGDKWGVGDLSFEVRNVKADELRAAVRGTLHVCDHTANKGATQTCKGHARGESCTFKFKSMGDSVLRWRISEKAYETPTTISTPQVTVTNAKATIKRRIESLKGRFSAAEMLATPSIVQAVEIGLITEADIKAMVGRAPKSSPTAPKQPKAAPKMKLTGKGPKPAAAKVAVKAEADDDEDE